MVPYIEKHKNQREICLLKAFPCAWGKCAFCDYIEDNSRDEAGMIALNNQVLNLVTGEYGVLEVINSGSCFELPKQTLDDIENVIKTKNIHTAWKAVTASSKRRFNNWYR